MYLQIKNIVSVMLLLVLCIIQPEMLMMDMLSFFYKAGFRKK